MKRIERVLNNSKKDGSKHRWTAGEKQQFKNWINTNPYADVSYDTGETTLNKKFPKVTSNSLYAMWLKLRKELGMTKTPRYQGFSTRMIAGNRLIIEIDLDRRIPIIGHKKGRPRIEVF